MAKPVPAVMTSRRLNRAMLLRSTALQAVVGLVVATPGFAQPAPSARPQGGQVVAGSAAIATTSNATTITQSTNRAAIDWRSFNVGSDQSVNFQQPSSTAVTLNRVTAGDPSAIAGKITANGQIVLTNPSGVTFYQGSQVNAQSVVVSAAGITNQNFMAGKMVFDQAAQPNARIENRGTITVKQAGLAALVAPSVANSGVINAKLGQVVLAGAAAHTLDMYGDGLVSIDVTKQVTQAPVGLDGKVVTALVTNTGTIRADGGVVQLTATAADGVVQTLVRAGGKIRTNSVGDRTGRIEITGTGGSVVVEGRIAADGRVPSTTGGEVMIAGSDTTTIAATAHVSASGKAGGGTVAIGTTLARARGTGAAPAGTSIRTIVVSGARVSADATDRGNGGRVTVLSTQQTSVDGTITALGGKTSGDGGTIEMSGDLGFSLTGSADTSAPHGALGTIIIDPRDLTISATSTGAPNATPANDADPNLGYATPDTTTDAYVTPTQLQALTGDLHLQASRDLVVASSVNYTNGNVTLEAGRNLTVNSGVTLSSNRSITLSAASSASPLYDPTGALTINGVVSAGGNGTLTAGTGGISIANDVTTNGSLLLSTTGAVSQTGGVVTTTDLYGSAASVSLQKANAITGIGIFGGSFVTTAGGFSLTTNSALAVGPNSGATGIVSVPSGQNILLGATAVTVQGGDNAAGTYTLSAPSGTVTIQPYSVNPITLTTSATKPSGLALSTTDLSLIKAGTLALAGATTITVGQTTDTGSLDLTTGGIGALKVQASGAMSQNIPLKVGALSGNAGSFDLTNASNAIPSISGLTTGGANAVTTSGALTLTSTDTGTTLSYSAGGPLTVSGAVAAGTVTLAASGTGALSISGTVVASQSVTLTGGTGGISLSGSVSATGALDLEARSGAVTETAAGSVSASDLTGNVGSLSLTSRSNAISGVASQLNTFTVTGATGDFSLVTSGALTIGSPSVSGGLAVQTGRAISIATDTLTINPPQGEGAQPVSAPSGTVTLTPFTVTNGILVTAGTTTPANTLTITTGMLGNITSDTVQFGATIGTTTMPTGTTTFGASTETGTLDFGSLGFTKLVTQTAGTVTQSAGVAVGVTSFSGQAGTLSLTNTSNAIQTLAGFSTTTGDLAFHTGGGLLIPAGSTVIANGGAGNVTLSSAAQLGSVTSTGGRPVGMQILGTVTGNTVSLNSLPNTGSPTSLNYGITEIDTSTNTNIGVINATTLTGAAGFAQLYGNNVLTNLGNFASYEELSITNVNASSVTGALSSTTYAVSLGAAGITQSSTSSITAPQLDVTSSANTVLTSPSNNLTGIGYITQSAGDFTLVNSSSSALLFGSNFGVVKATTGSLTFVTNQVGITSSPNANTAIAASNGTVTFTPYTIGRPIELIGSSAASASSLSLSQTFLNLVAAGTLRLGVPAGTLPAAGTGIAGSGIATSAINIGNSGEIISLTSHATTLSLVSSGDVTQGGTSLAVSNLTGNTASLALQGTSNQIGAVTGYTAINSFALSDGQSLTISGALTAPTVSLTSSAALTLAGAVSASNTLSLSATGAITQPSGSINTQTLFVSAASATLGSTSNVVNNLSQFSTTGNFTLYDSTSLTITQTSDPNVVTMTVLGNLAVDNVITAGSVVLTVTGAITEDSAGVGKIVATTLTGSAASANLSNTNQVGTLGSFQTTNGLNLVNGVPLTVSGPVTDGQSIALSTTGVLTLSGTVTAPAVTLASAKGPSVTGGISQTAGVVTGTTSVSLTSAGTIDQTGGTIAAGTLSGTSSGTTSLVSAGNAVATLGSFSSAGGFALKNGQTLAVSGPVSDSTSVTLGTTGALSLGGTVTTGALSLTATGAITQPGGSVVANTLTGSGGSVALTQRANQVDSLGNFGSTGNFALTDSLALTVSGGVSAAPGGTLTLVDDVPTFGAAGSLSAPSGTVVLSEYTAGNGITLGGGAVWPRPARR